MAESDEQRAEHIGALVRELENTTTRLEHAVIDGAEEVAERLTARVEAIKVELQKAGAGMAKGRKRAETRK